MKRTLPDSFVTLKKRARARRSSSEIAAARRAELSQQGVATVLSEDSGSDSDYPMLEAALLQSSGESDSNIGQHKRYVYRQSTTRPGRVGRPDPLDAEQAVPSDEEVDGDGDLIAMSTGGSAANPILIDDDDEDDDLMVGPQAGSKPEADPAFLLLMPAYADGMPEKLAERIRRIIYQEAFGETPQASAQAIDAEGRLEMVVGFNRPRTPSKRLNDLLAEAMQTEMPGYVHVKGFFWQPAWVKVQRDEAGQIIGESKVSAREVRAFYKAKKAQILAANLSVPETIAALDKVITRLHAPRAPIGVLRCKCEQRKEVCTHKRTKRKAQNPIPYKQIRDVLLNSQLVAERIRYLQGKGRTVYVCSFDEDFRELRHQTKAHPHRSGIFTTYTQLIRAYRQAHDGVYPEITSTGIRYKLLKHQKSYLLLDLGSKVDGYARKIMSELFYDGMIQPPIYLPEPNSAFKVPHNSLFKERYRYQIGRKNREEGENVALVAAMYAHRKLGQGKVSRLVYTADNPLRTATPHRAFFPSQRHPKQYDFSGEFAEDEHVVVGFSQYDIEKMMSVCQSHADCDQFKTRIVATVPFKRRSYELSIGGELKTVSKNQARNLLKHLVYRVYSMYHPVYCTQRAFAQLQSGEFEAHAGFLVNGLPSPSRRYLDVLKTCMQRYPELTFQAVPPSANRGNNPLLTEVNAITSINIIQNLVAQIAGQSFAEQLCPMGGIAHRCGEVIAQVLSKHLCFAYSENNRAVWHDTFQYALSNVRYESACNHQEEAHVTALETDIFSDRNHALNACKQYNDNIMDNISSENASEQSIYLQETLLDVNFKFNATALHLAAASGNVRLVIHLIQEHGFTIKDSGEGDVKPIHCALIYCARYGYEPGLIERLITNQKLNERTEQGDSLVAFIMKNVDEPLRLLRQVAHLDKDVLAFMPCYEQFFSDLDEPFHSEHFNPVDWVIERDLSAIAFAHHLMAYGFEPINLSCAILRLIKRAIERNDSTLLNDVNDLQAYDVEPEALEKLIGEPMLNYAICRGSSVALISALIACGFSVEAEQFEFQLTPLQTALHLLLEQTPASRCHRRARLSHRLFEQICEQAQYASPLTEAERLVALLIRHSTNVLYERDDQGLVPVELAMMANVPRLVTIFREFGETGEFIGASSQMPVSSSPRIAM